MEQMTIDYIFNNNKFNLSPAVVKCYRSANKNIYPNEYLKVLNACYKELFLQINKLPPDASNVAGFYELLSALKIVIQERDQLLKSLKQVNASTSLSEELS